MPKEINIKFTYEEDDDTFEELSVEYETGDNHAMLAHCLAYIASTEFLKKPCFMMHFEEDFKELSLKNILGKMAEKLDGSN